MARDPSFSILYAPLKSGKTADALAAFPGAVYIAAPGALSAAESLWGYEQPKAHDLESFRDVRQFAEKLPSGTVALVVDDATLIADRTVNALKDRGVSGFDLWAAMFTTAIRMRDSLRRRGIHVVFTCHERGAHMDQGVRVKGGPSFPGQVAQKLPAAADLLLRAEARPGLTGFGWPMVYRTSPHADWLQGSRYTTPDLCPMNLGEILRLAGFAIPRLRGLEWQEKIAEVVAGQIMSKGIADADHVKATLQAVKDYALAKLSKSEPHVYWALRDGYDRAMFRTANAASRRSMWGV